MPALTTAFDENLQVDHEFVARHARWQIENGVSGLVALGSLGEAATLRMDEKLAIIETLVSAVEGKVPVVAAISALSTDEAVALAQRAEERGAERTHDSAPVCVPGRLGGDEGACGRGARGHGAARNALQQSGRVRHRLHARADPGTRRRVPQPAGGEGVVNRRAPRDRHPRAGGRPAGNLCRCRRCHRRGHRGGSRGLDRGPGQRTAARERGPLRVGARRQGARTHSSSTAGFSPCCAWTRCRNSFS